MAIDTRPHQERTFANNTARAGRPPLEEFTDGELLDAFRTGRTEAYGELFRRYEPVAMRVASRRTRDHHLAQEAVHEAFTTILCAIRSGSGPTGTFTGYLYSCVTREVARQHHLRRNEVSVPEYVDLLPGMVLPDVADQFPDPGIRQAFMSLPERWQRVIWHLDIYELAPREAAPLFGLSPNALIALHRRAKKGFRQAFLQQQLTEQAPAQTAVA
jgi:RNA polymerase sigma factor (sigma-70 family)